MLSSMIIDTAMVLLGLPLLSTAAPSSSWKAPVSHLATFEDRTTLPGVAALTPVGDYEGLHYAGLNVLQAGAAGIATGVKPQSGHNTAVRDLTTAVFSSPILTAAPGTKAFDLESLYFGCVLNTAETAASAPQQCTLSFSAYKDDPNEPVKTVSAAFVPNNLLVADMREVEFPPRFWCGLSKVEIALVEETSTAETTAVLFDNFKYKTFA